MAHTSVSRSPSSSPVSVPCAVRALALHLATQGTLGHEFFIEYNIIMHGGFVLVYLFLASHPRALVPAHTDVLHSFQQLHNFEK